MDSHRTHKKLIVCCDGTWQNNSSSLLQAATNVTRIGRAVQPEDKQGVPQIVYYQAGIGSTSLSLWDHLFAGATGGGLSENIREAYSFLTNNYEHTNGNKPDEIFLLGFSRGAFTARSIGGMIGALGLLTKQCMELHFHDIFSDFENAGVSSYIPKLPQTLPAFVLPRGIGPADIDTYLPAYMQTLKDLGLTREVRITAIGVWDTVGSLGVPIVPIFQRLFGRAAFQDYQFYDTAIDNHVDHAFHALALDETRSTFVPSVWERPAGFTTKLKQVWFAGAHSDVGGGFGSLDTSAQDISLAWMMDQLSPWVDFDPAYLDVEVKQQIAAGVTPSRWGCGEIHDSRTGFWLLAGLTQRTPDQYHRTDYQTGMYTEEELQNTNEMVHASVKERKRYGSGANGRAKYDTPFTREWSEDGGEWNYIGDSKLIQGKVIPEDTLGAFERQLRVLVDRVFEERYGDGQARR